jgi:hypothetical protein
MDYFDKQQSTEPPKIPAVLAALAEINSRESDVREQPPGERESLPASQWRRRLDDRTCRSPGYLLGFWIRVRVRPVIIVLAILSMFFGNPNTVCRAF